MEFFSDSQSSDVPASLHADFLDATRRGVRPDQGRLAGFLVLRLVDASGESGRAGAAEALKYQLNATAESVAALPKTAERGWLDSIVAGVGDFLGSRGRQPLLSGLVAYADWLEQELHLDESVDVLRTAQRALGVSVEPSAVSVYLALGRSLRLLGRLHESKAAYERAEGAARELGDDHGRLLSTIGHAYTLQKTGNLPASEHMLRSALAQGVALGDRDAEARACHDLAICVFHMGRPVEAAPLAFRAFRLYDQPQKRTRALSDTGQILKETGQYDAAGKALRAALEREPPPEVRVRILVELLDLHALMENEIAFGRLRKEIEVEYDRIPIDERVDFELKLGRGLARFGRLQQARAHLDEALQLAEQHGLPEWLFRAEALLAKLEDAQGAESCRAPSPGTQSSTDLDATIADLEALSVGELAHDGQR
jgi:tetratricopeptide (TPR) repeat protein